MMRQLQLQNFCLTEQMDQGADGDESEDNGGWKQRDAPEAAPQNQICT